MSTSSIRCMNANVGSSPVTAYAPVDGVEIRTVVFADNGTLYAKRPGNDAGIVAVDPAKTYIVRA